MIDDGERRVESTARLISQPREANNAWRELLITSVAARTQMLEHLAHLVKDGSPRDADYMRQEAKLLREVHDVLTHPRFKVEIVAEEE